jgi:hypothetical protein
MRVDPDLPIAWSALREAGFVIGMLVPEAPPPLYARIDLVHDAGGRPVVLELELTEPSLFLPQAPEAATSLARAVEAELAR